MSTTPQQNSSPQQNTSLRDASGDIIIDEAARSASRKKLVWIFALFFLPLLLATIWFQVVQTGAISWGSTSRGELIDPAVPLTEFVLQEQGNDEPFVLDEVRGKWTIMYVPGAQCDDACKQALIDIRQTRLALNHRMARVQRVLLTDLSTAFDDEFTAAQVGLRIVGGSPDAIASLTDQVNKAQSDMEAKSNLVYLIDPLGNLMMRYTPDQLSKPLFKDIKHLLKSSRIG